MIRPRFLERHIDDFEMVGYWRANGAEGRGKKVFTEIGYPLPLSVIVDRHTGLVLHLHEGEWFRVPQRTDDSGNAISEDT